MKEKTIKLLAAVRACLERAVRNERGQGTLEYAVIVVVAITIAVAIGAIMTQVGEGAGTAITSKAAEVFTTS